MRTSLVVRSEGSALSALSAAGGNPPLVVGKRPTPPPAIYSSNGLPTEVVDLAGHIDSGASDMAIVLLRGGLVRKMVQVLVAAWVTEMRYGHTHCLDNEASDAPAPHLRSPVLGRPSEDWRDETGSSWEELQDEAAQPPRRFE
ncbi:MAG: hypothetical protein ACRYHQ_24150 [Janthinobacterium lividum]